jgi:lipoprotein signal peptidase
VKSLDGPPRRRGGHDPEVNGSDMNAATTRSYLWLFWLLAGLGLVADQASKYGIFTWLYSDGTPMAEETVLGTFALVTEIRPDPPPREARSTREVKIVPGTFDIVAAHTAEREEGSGILASLRRVSGDQLPFLNRGALFGWGGGRTDGQDLNTLFAIVSLLAAAGIIYWSTRTATRSDRLLCAALGLILAGTLGNLYDRVVFSGVRDFLHWYRFYDWPVFNLADSCLVCGAAVLLIHAFFAVEQHTDATASVAAEAPAEAATAEPMP